jgi:hypothetical protein
VNGGPLAVIAARLRQPLIIACIAPGALLGPHVGINLVHDEESIAGAYSASSRERSLATMTSRARS